MRDLAFVGLGSNLGDREGFLAAARARLAALPRSRVRAVSTVEETAPIGPPGQNAYLNQMVALETELTPRELLHALQEIEHACGRTRELRWGPRTLDLDIVQFEHQVVQDDDLRVPHPAIGARDFWQRELQELRELLAT
ncbi:MAG TPA: 2-amino-4-hydroxy-6-hydroxymethyldihydropteridine diphosphokinase [Gemmatimonadaceae bacterium]|nr:2-amino-4-hydroxy-6-hydroxymethyldihydropteridine diphosphokinase [Gemmatimonadaceae bacterium]